MKRANNMKFNLINSSLKEYDLNKSSIGCAPCLEEALKINKRSLTEIKIDEIKSIVRSIFKNSKNGTK